MLLQRLETLYERGFTEYCRSVELGPKAAKESIPVLKATRLLVLPKRVHSFIEQKVLPVRKSTEGDMTCL
jgi:hypothetical protein